MTTLGDRFDKALVYASTLHAAQIRKQAKDDLSPGIPYISHLLSVCGLVIEYGGDEDQAIGALLHDAAEDQGGQRRLDDIRRRFGDGVADIVHACSDSLVAEEKKAWCIRKRKYIESIATKHRPALLVTAADKLHNMRAINSDYANEKARFWKKFPRKDADVAHEGEGLPHRTAGHTYWYHDQIRAALAARAQGPGSDGLARAVSELARENERLLKLASTIEEQNDLETFNPCPS